MINRFEINERHAKHVQFIVLKLFNALSSITNYKDTDKKILSTAALLHDIGTHIEYYDHHVHGFYLILNGRLEGLTNPERISVAFLVGSHREAGIKSRMVDFENILSKAELNRLGKLVVLLNIAEQLDRAENCAVKDLEIIIESDRVLIKLISDESTELEKASAKRFSERFEKHIKFHFQLSSHMFQLLYRFKSHLIRP